VDDQDKTFASVPLSGRSNLADVPFKLKCARIIFPTTKTMGKNKINHNMSLLWIRMVFNAAQFQLFISMRIRIQVAKSMWIRILVKL
jgi:hypothetical protein